ncbi:LTA synthase family protein [Neobacillus mesonae]|uniref:LTA synthase family protein n=1 Tax=Neobacillus mesonae TaxID=1193713 RepID=UPI002041E180|nr:alkaline phosphatase family protein [Neobacillus mesonae]MCM3571220.1 sulfatase-like hydrolase/transferase [Neobacillus mesonae]
MKRVFKADLLILYFFVSLLWMELIFRAALQKGSLSFGVIISCVFLLSIAFLFSLIGGFFKGFVSRFISIALLFATALLYSSQYIYYKFFKTFYTFYSIHNGGQIVEFWKDIAAFAGKHAGWLLLFFTPVFVLALLGEKFLLLKKSNSHHRLLLAGWAAFFHLAGIAAVYAGNHGQNSAFDLYFKNNDPLLAVQRLGLITTMRLDLQRNLTDWSPQMNLSGTQGSKYIPKPKSPEKQLEDHSNEHEAAGKMIEYNTMDFDFASLAAKEKNQTLKGIHQYFEQVEPTAKNKYTGKYKGYNLILITAEGFSPYGVQKNVTPTLYKMVNSGFKFTHFYNPIWGVSTSDGEYAACTGLIPKSGVWSFKKSGKNFLPFVMGNQLQKLNYKTMAFHNHSYTYYGRNISHPNMGYVYKAVGNGLKIKKTWPESDLEMMEKTIPEYINNQPFHTYYMTVSGHMQYSFTGNFIAHKNKKNVQNLPYSDQAKAYIATQVELDRALEYLLKQLEEAGIADKTLIALSPDHYPYGLDLKTIDELAGHHVEKNFELYKSTFILYTKGMKPKTITKPVSSLDIIPTLSNLLGLEFDSRLLMGQDIFSDASPLVIFSNKSFITDKGRYDSVSNKFIANSGKSVSKEYVQKMKAIVERKFYFSSKILDTDYYRKIFVGRF